MIGGKPMPHLGDEANADHVDGHGSPGRVSVALRDGVLTGGCGEAAGEGAGAAGNCGGVGPVSSGYRRTG